MSKLRGKKTCIVCDRDSANIFSCRYKCREENKRELESYFRRELSLGHLCDRCYRANYKFKLARKARKDLEEANRAQQQAPMSEESSPASSQSPSSQCVQQLSPPPLPLQPNHVSTPTAHLSANERESSHASEASAFGFPRSAFHSPLPSTSPRAKHPSSLNQNQHPPLATTLVRHSSFTIQSLCATTSATLPLQQTAAPTVPLMRPAPRRHSMEIRFLLASSENESSTTLLDPFRVPAPFTSHQPQNPNCNHNNTQ